MAARKIQPLSYRDLPQMIRLAAQSFRELPARQPAQLAGYLLPILQRHPDWGWKAVRGARLEGYIVGQPHPATASVSIMHLAVSPECQRKGLGSKLLAVLEDRARREELSRVRLATVYAARFYEQHGYHPLGADHKLIKEICGHSCPPVSDPRFSLAQPDDLKHPLRALDEDVACRFLQAYYRWYGPGFCLLARSGHRLKALLVAGPRALEEIGGLNHAAHPPAYDLFATEFWYAADDALYPVLAAALAHEASQRGARFIGLQLERGREDLLPRLEKHGFIDSDWPSWHTLYWYEKDLA